MPSGNIVAGQVSVADYGNVPGTGINREDLANVLTLLAQTQTPLLQQSASNRATHPTTHDWPEDGLTDPKSARDAGAGTGSLVSGQISGTDFSPSDMTVPVRNTNFLQIFRRDVSVDRDQILANPAGVKNTFAHSVRKVMQELTRAVEARTFSVLDRDGNQTQSTGSPRLMKTLEQFSRVANGGVAGNIVAQSTTDDTPATITEPNFLDVAESMGDEGGSATDAHLSAGVKRTISQTFTGIGTQQAPLMRSVAPSIIQGTVSVYESVVGAVRLHWNPWVTRETEDTFQFDGTAIAEDSADPTGLGPLFTRLAGRAWLVRRGNIRFSWFDRLHTESIGKRGDSLAGLVRGSVTVEIGSQKALGVVTGISD